ncbi:MAG: DUF2202 domain-containing protein [Chloroflexi bacterium]|nr:DUF2202 domain-containing protein [Chloroflexota bacterium]
MKHNTIVFLFGLILLLALAGCGAAAADLPAVDSATLTAVNPTTTAQEGAAVLPRPTPVIVAEGGDGETAVAAIQPVTVTNQLSDAEIAALHFMREEEKLAHDIYLVLHDMWGLPILQNIAASELNHVESVLRVLAQYGLPDPAVGNPAGVFNDPTLQNLYHQMVAQGGQSLLEALNVGATIEEVDILDLQARLAQTTNPDILRVYQSLLAGSANHLRSFARLIEQQTGAAYEPQYLTDAVYAEILALAGENGRNGQGAGGQGQGQGAGSQGQGQGNPGQGQGNRGAGSGRGGQP